MNLRNVRKFGTFSQRSLRLCVSFFFNLSLHVRENTFNGAGGSHCQLR